MEIKEVDLMENRRKMSKQSSRLSSSFSDESHTISLGNQDDEYDELMFGYNSSYKVLFSFKLSLKS